MTKSLAQLSSLISLLLEASTPFGDRHDAAMDLGEHDEPVAEAALLEVVSNLAEDPDIADAAGESLYSLWSRSGRTRWELIESFHPEARKFFMDLRD